MSKKPNTGKPSNKNKGGKPNSGKGNRVVKSGCDKSKDIDMNVPDDKSGDINDSSYYYYSDDLKKQICNFSFNEYLGVEMPFGDYDDQLIFTNKQYPANVMAICINPSVAPTGDPTLGRVNGINLAGLKNFTDLTKKNGRNRPYGPEVITILLLYLAEIIKMVSFCSRPFGILTWFDVRNRAIPRLYFDAMDIDYDDFVANAADYRIKLNTIIANIDKIPIPLNVPILAKAADWYKTIYVDKDNPMHQSYLFVPYSTWMLNESGTTGGSSLDTTYLRTLPEDPEADRTFNRYLDTLNLMVQKLLQSSTMQDVFSDMMLCASNGELKLGSLTMIPSDYRIEMALSSEIRNWLHNMVILSPPVPQDWKHELYSRGNTGENDVWASAQDTGIIYNPEFYGSGIDGNWRDYANRFFGSDDAATNVGYKCQGSLIIDFDHEPTDDEKIECLRLANRGTWKYDTTDSTKYHIYSNDQALGDAYVADVRIYSADTEAANRLSTCISSPSGSKKVDIIGHLTDFNDFPMTYIYEVGSRSGDRITFGRFAEMGELNYFTFIDKDFMRRMFDAEMISMFTFR